MRLAEILKLLGDENRLRILNLLLEETLCVCDIENILDITQSNVSRHLNKLKMAGILSASKKSQWMYYKMNEEFLAKHQKLVEYLKEEFSQNNVFQKDLLRLKEQKKGNICELHQNDKSEMR